MKSSSYTLPHTSTALDAVEEADVPCYLANGDLAEGFHKCDLGSPVSSCCPPGYSCSGDALCALTTPSPLEQPDLASGTVSRGACTEPRWDGNSCGGNCLDSENATRAADCAPVGDVGGDQSCCAGGNAPGGCICSSNVAGITLGVVEKAQAILGRRAGPFSQTIAHKARGKEARLHRASKTIPQGVVSTVTGSPEMFPGDYSTWLDIDSSVVSISVITPVTPPTSSRVWSEIPAGSSMKLSTPVATPPPGTTTIPSIYSTETPITTTISIIASSLIRSSTSSPSTSASNSPSVPTVIPVFPDGSSAPDTTSSEATTSSLATKLGLGLGIPLVVLAVALVTAGVYRRQRRVRYAQAPPFDFGAPEMGPVSAADFVPAVNCRDHHRTARSNGAQQQAYGYGSPVASRRWSEMGGHVGAGGAWTGTRATAWGGGGPYDDNQVGFVDRLSGNQGYYSYGGHGIPASSPVPTSGYEDIGSPYEDRGHTYQVPVVQVHGPQWTPAPTLWEDPDLGQGQGRGLEQPPQQGVARVSRGLSVNEEVSPLSSTGSGMPYPRMSAISGMGWETNPRESRG